MSNIITKKGVCMEGKVIVPCEYDDMKPAIQDGEESTTIYVTVQNNALSLLKLDTVNGGYYIAKSEYCLVEDFKNGVAVVADYCDRFGTKYGLIDEELNELLECLYDRITPLSDNLYAVSKKGEYGVYDVKDKKFIISTNFKSVSYSASNIDSGEYTEKITLEI